MPQISDLKKSYYRLQFDKNINEEYLVNISQWVRFDPRLGEILVHYVSINWQNFNALKINQDLKTVPWPQVFGLLLEHVKYLNTSAIFNNWKNLVLSGVQVTQYELFYLGLYKFKGKFQEKEHQLANDLFLKWGYYSYELLLKKSVNLNRTFLNAKKREKLLESFLKTHKIFNVEKYRTWSRGLISKRQCQIDLKKNENIKSKGFTQNRLYFLA